MSNRSHVEAALPEVDWLENSLLSWDALVAEPVRFENGSAIAPERLGHGLPISEAAQTEFASPDGT